MKNTYLEQYKAGQLRACQLKQLSILEEIDRICQKHQIGYWLDGGTLLGLREVLFLQTPQNEPQSKEPIVKVRDLNSFYVEGADNFAADYQKGLYVDIFPMINYPTLPKQLVKRVTLGISRSYSILHKAHYYSLRAFAEFFWFGAKYLLNKALWSLLCAVRPKNVYLSNILINNGYGIMHWAPSPSRERPSVHLATPMPI